MTPIFPELPYPLGVYSLTRLLELREYTELYEARQTHVDRAVVLETCASLSVVIMTLTFAVKMMLV